MLTVVDNFSRECLAIEVDGSRSSQRVTRVLDWIITQRRAPVKIRCDNELSSSEKWKPLT